MRERRFRDTGAESPGFTWGGSDQEQTGAHHFVTVVIFICYQNRHEQGLIYIIVLIEMRELTLKLSTKVHVEH